jgi:predicted KAP-like P-loop ATPase
MESILRSINNNNKDDFSKFLKYLITQIRSDGSTKLSIFLERMEDYISEIQQDNIPIVIETFFTIGDELIIPEDEFGGILISSGNNIKMGRITWKLLQRYNDRNKRFEILKNAFENGRAISMMADELISLWQQYEDHRVKGKYDENMIVENEHLKILQEIVLDKIREAAKDNKLLTTPLLPHVLYCWNKWGIKNEVKEWVSAIINSDEKLPIFLSKFLQKNTSWAINDKVYRIHWRLNPNSLKDYIDIDTLEKRCNYILSNDSIANNLDDRQKLAIKQFLKEKRILDDGKSR